MTDEQWDTIAMLLDKGFKWREPFGEAQLTTYRILLDGYNEEQIGNALRSLVTAGQVFGPTPGEIIKVIRTDPSRPTFDEAYRLIYGPGGVFGFKRSGVTISPWVLAFVDRYGKDRLRALEVEHEDYGPMKRRELQQSWEQFLEATEGRDVAAIASRRGEGLARLDPLSSLGISPPKELTR